MLGTMSAPTVNALIIDDAEDILDFATLSFDLKGWTSHTAETGAEGLRKAAELKPQVILLDFDLNGETGLDVLAQLQASPATARIPVIFLTGSDSPADRQTFVKAGALGLIPKPFDPMQLADRVALLLNSQGYL